MNPEQRRTLLRTSFFPFQSKEVVMKRIIRDDKLRPYSVHLQLLNEQQLNEQPPSSSIRINESHPLNPVAASLTDFASIKYRKNQDKYNRINKEKGMIYCITNITT